MQTCMRAVFAALHVLTRKETKSTPSRTSLWLSIKSLHETGSSSVCCVLVAATPTRTAVCGASVCMCDAAASCPMLCSPNCIRSHSESERGNAASQCRLFTGGCNMQCSEQVHTALRARHAQMHAICVHLAVILVTARDKVLLRTTETTSRGAAVLLLVSCCSLALYSEVSSILAVTPPVYATSSCSAAERVCTSSRSLGRHSLATRNI